MPAKNVKINPKFGIILVKLYELFKKLSQYFGYK